jgi:SAM-dependent methyltransferase
MVVMVDTKAISKTMISKLKQRIFGKSPYGNDDWNKANDNWYSAIHNSNYLLHENFIKYLKEKIDVRTILEVGCGTGVYPIKHHELFIGRNYTGIDISQANIEYCKKNSKFEFLCGDFIKMNLDKKYDLVFSHAVIDHVHDIDAFLMKLMKVCKKYAYINSYRGYFPELEKHQMEWRESDRCYYNNISIKQVEKVLLGNGLTNKEFIIRSQKSGQTQPHLDDQLVIEIAKNQIP